MSDPAPAADGLARPRFVTGSIARHILVMTGTAAIGLMAVFIGELISLLLLGLLRDQEVLAAMGYASTIQFFSTSVGIGLSIATTSVVAPAAGRGDREATRRLAVNAHVFAAIAGCLVAFAIYPWLGAMLTGMGAGGRTHALAHAYLSATMPTLPLTSIGMCSMAVLRSVGDAERSMSVTLVSAAVSVAVEPFCIFMLKLGIMGSALALVIARIAFVMVGLIGVFAIHRLTSPIEWRRLALDGRPMAAVAVPAVLTNVATPIANLFTTAALARHGDAAMAAWAIIGRVTPVAFGIVFCLSGAVGPVIGQNYGAHAYDRVRATLTAALWANAGFCALAWLGVVLLAPSIVSGFGLSGRAAELIHFYARWVAPLFVFLGMLFIANAAFNTLGMPRYATVLNWARATLGTIPFVWLGSHYWNAEGVFAGNLIGSIAFGVAGTWIAYRRLPR
jgi:putative MATE family efflux protein